MSTQKHSPGEPSSQGGVEVQVFRSRRRADTYLFLPAGDEYEDLPEALREHFGEATAFLTFRLHAARYLEQADPRQVLAALEAQGFYLQLPPSPEQPPQQTGGASERG